MFRIKWVERFGTPWWLNRDKLRTVNEEDAERFSTETEAYVAYTNYLKKWDNDCYIKRSFRAYIVPDEIEI